MSAGRAALAIAVGLCNALGAVAVSADPASSADSAWSPLPSQREADAGDSLVERGREVFDQRCAACHDPIPEEIFGPPFLPPMPGTQALRDRYGGALPAALEERTDLTPAYIEAVVRDGLRSMPFFRPTELSDEDLRALATYLSRERNAAED